MDMNEAQKLVGGLPAPTVSEHRAALSAKYAGAPQRGTAVDLAMRQIEEGIQVLAAHGHVYALIEADPSGGPGQIQRFPMMVYRGPGEQMTVEGEAGLEEAVQNGWRERQSPEPLPEDGPSAEMEAGPQAAGQPSTIQAVHPPEEQKHSEPKKGEQTFNAPLFPVTVLKDGNEKVVHDQAELDGAQADGWQQKQGEGGLAGG